MSESSTIRWERDDDGVVILTLDDPNQSANTMNAAYAASIRATLDRLEAERDEIKGVIITSAKKTFFAGGDLNDLRAATKEQADEIATFVSEGKAVLRRLETLGRPVVAAVNGSALGGGLEITLACDIRLAATGGYKLGLPEVTLGLLPGNGGTQRLTRLIGPSRALELLLTGRTYGVEEAHTMGLVAAVHDADAAEAQVREYAVRLATGPALAIAAIKRCVHEGGQKTLDEGLALEAELMEALFRSKDADEGLHAFVEKRKPEFVGSCRRISRPRTPVRSSPAHSTATPATR